VQVPKLLVPAERLQDLELGIVSRDDRVWVPYMGSSVTLVTWGSRTALGLARYA